MNRIRKRDTEKMSDSSFKGMTFIFKLVDFLFPYVKKRIKKFNIKPGMIVVDYGCGPGRYTIPFAKIVGDSGKVYAVDIHEKALEIVNEKMKKMVVSNIKTIKATGNDEGKYYCGLPNNIADIVCAIDMFFVIKKPKEFLNELKRILKKDGILIIDDGHQNRRETKEKINSSSVFDIFEETKDHLKCKIKMEEGKKDCN